MTIIFSLLFFLVVFFPFVRFVIFNLHNITIYGYMDLIAYFKDKKWKDFNYFGIDMYVAMFGHGKTLSMTNKAHQLYRQYGDKITFYSNYKLIGIPYIPLINFNQLVDLGEDMESDKVGTVVLIDEISAVLSHRNYSNFPLDLLNMLLQQRKKKIYIMCTAQRFFMVDKIWRSITTRVIDCNKSWRFQKNSYFDAWEYENAMNTDIIKRLGVNWWFVKDKIYNSYDTSEMIGKTSSKDFISNEESIVRKGFDSQVNEYALKKPTRKFKKMIKK